MEENDSLTIEVIVEGFANTNGQAIIGLYGVENAFPAANDVLDYRYLKIESGKVVTTFKVNKAGEYAVAAHHDSNNNRILDKNFLGMPTEAYGFSNNPTVRFRAPSFDECKFKVSKNTSIKIRI